MIERGFANKTYAAEWSVWKGEKAARHREPMGMVEARELATKLGVEIDIRRSRSRGNSGHYYPVQGGKAAFITIGHGAGRWVVLHELAHAVAWPQGDEGHGPGFRKAYVALVRQELGDWWADRLLGAFNKRNLKMS